MTHTAGGAQLDSRSLAASLAPVLIQACAGKLSDITWFKTDWQRGGAATAKARFELDDGHTIPVVLKLPVVRRELVWTQRLQQADPSSQVAPRLLAGGEEVGGYDLAWLVIEHFQFGPLGLHWHDDHVPRITAAAAQFHLAASAFEADQPPKHEPWDELLAESQDSVRLNLPSHRQQWLGSIKSLRARASALEREWNDRHSRQWLHGDLHLANAMSRVGETTGPVCLIDLAEVHCGHWVEDAVYLERQLWARPERLKLHKPVKALASARKHLGLSVDGDYPRLAMIRRAFLAATAPRFLKSEGHPAYLEACLAWLGIALNELK